MSKLMDRCGERVGRVIFFLSASSAVGLVLADMLLQAGGRSLQLHSGHFACCTALMVAGLGLTHLCKKDTTHAEEK